MGRIALVGLEFYGRHGVKPEEGALGARFIVDVELEVPFEGQGDSLEATVDYAEVHRLVAAVVTGERFYLIEALADTIADRLMAAFPGARSLVVRVHKPHAPLPGVFRDVYAETSRRRSDF
ncbi:dihydroneopterin aldolase [Oceanithermus sp.]